MRILVVDDDEFLSNAAASLVKKAGHTVSGQQLSGAACLESLAEATFMSEPCEVILLDYELGDMTALAVMQQICGRDANGAPQYPWLAGVDIVVVSGHQFNQGYQEELKKLGVQKFWTKPVTMESIEGLCS